MLLIAFDCSQIARRFFMRQKVIILPTVCWENKKLESDFMVSQTEAKNEMRKPKIGGAGYASE